MSITDREVATPHSGTPDVEAIESLKREGLNQREIAATLGIAQSTVSKYLKRMDLVLPDPRWGLGPAQLVEPAVRKGDELVVFLSDPHYPYQDKAMLAASLRLLRALQPHRVVLNGDWDDMFALSRFNRGLERLDQLQEELDEGNAGRDDVRAAAPNALLEETRGNHMRLSTYIQQHARPLTSLRALHPENIFHWKKNEIRPHDDNGFLLREEFLVKHGNVARASGTAKAEYEMAGISGTSGHIHRFDTYEKNGYRKRGWWSSGCLCRTDPDYVPGGMPNWKQGLMVGTFSSKTNAFEMERAIRYGNGLLFGGKVY
jgi:transcriptional regulator with XRE-family HTH domain